MITARPPSALEQAAISEALLAARLLRPYLARALAALHPVVVEGLGSVAVDSSWRLYVDPVWLASLTPSEAAHVLACHEIEHLIRRHDRLLAIAAPKLARNWAGDAEINDDVPAGCLPAGGVYPASLGCADGLLAEDYLRAILDGAEHSDQCCGGGSGAGEPQPWELPADDAPAIDPLAAEQIRAAVASDIRSHAERHPGTVPAHLVVWADAEIERTRPRYDWRRELASELARGRPTRGTDDSTWSRPSRRYRYGGPLLPARLRREPRVGIVVDTSGSMRDEGSVVLGAVQAICRSHGECRTWYGDVGTAGVARGAPRRYLGGGGTDLRDMLSEADRWADVLVVVTDCETPWSDAAPRARCVVAATGTTTAPNWAVRVQL